LPCRNLSEKVWIQEQLMNIRLILIAFALISLIVSCQEATNDQTVQQRGEPKQVVTASVVSAASSAHLEFAGTVIPQNRAVIESKIQAWVTRIPVSLGMTVKKGDLLIELDSRDLEARVAQAKAAQHKASAELKRYDGLLEKQLASQKEFDAIQAEAEAAAAALLEAQAALSYAKIIAPFSGTITQLMTDAGDIARSGSPLLTLEESGPLLFSAMLPESRLGHLQAEDTVHIHIPSIDSIVAGTISMLSPSVDPISHTFEVRVKLPTVGGMRAGMFGRIQIVNGEQTVWVPSRAIVKRGQLDLVYGIDENQKAILRLVRIGQQFPDKTEILAGLREGERIVIDGQNILSDGDSVKEVM
jgi:RND family efflux transporter MFP subunit